MLKTLDRASASSQTSPSNLINKTINFVYSKVSFLDPSNLELHVIKFTPGGLVLRSHPVTSLVSLRTL